jgi:hypothetical protein
MFILYLLVVNAMIASNTHLIEVTTVHIFHYYREGERRENIMCEGKTTSRKYQSCHLIFKTLHCRLNNTDNKKKNLFTALKKNERDKKKLIDTVLKQLRGLMNGTASI